MFFKSLAPRSDPTPVAPEMTNPGAETQIASAGLDEGQQPALPIHGARQEVMITVALRLSLLLLGGRHSLPVPGVNPTHRGAKLYEG
jgi:hypothetical protein